MVDGDADDLEVAGAPNRRQALEQRDFLAARRAPGRPEIDDQRLAAQRCERTWVCRRSWPARMRQTVGNLDGRLRASRASAIGSLRGRADWRLPAAAGSARLGGGPRRDVDAHAGPDRRPRAAHGPGKRRLAVHAAGSGSVRPLRNSRPGQQEGRAAAEDGDVPRVRRPGCCAGAAGRALGRGTHFDDRRVAKPASAQPW